MKMEEQNVIRALIVDDEQDGREVLRHLIAAQTEGIQVMAEAANLTAAKQLIESTNPELVFLDIHMGAGHIFSMLDEFEEINFEIIFVTSYEQYSLTAIKFNALDYLLKPIDIFELKVAVEKAKRRVLGKRTYEALVRNMLDSLDMEVQPRKVAVHIGDSVLLVALSTVIYIEADGNYCTMATTTGEKYIVTRMIGEFEEYLGPKSDFVRINRSVLASVAHIVKYSKGFPCMLTMADGKVFEVARRKKVDVIGKLGEQK